MPLLLLWALHLGPEVAGSFIPGGQSATENACNPGQINTRIHAIPAASALEHIEDKVMLGFVLQWAKDGKTPESCIESCRENLL